MTEQQRPDEDVEGHGGRRYAVDPEASDEDVEGHGRKFAVDEGSADDVAGHGRRAPDEGDDVGGHGWTRQ